MTMYSRVNDWVSIICVSLGILGVAVVLYGGWGAHLLLAVFIGVASILLILIGVSE